jgi:2TM domain-containing protein
MDEQQKYELARKRVEAKLGFYNHLAVYVIVNAIILIVNLATEPDDLWFYWPMLGWGIGLAFHALNVFGFGVGSGRKEDMIRKEMGKL